MVPPELSNFFIASASAGGALLGLLFVAVSIAPEQIVTPRAPIERQAVAASTFTALLNAFFVSLAALIPGSLAWAALTMSSLGLLNSLTLAVRFLRHPKSWQNFIRRVFLILASFIIYGYEFYYALRLAVTRSALENAYVLAVLLLTIYGLGLVRAWELLGVQRFGLLTWLNPLYDLNNPMSIPTDHLSDSTPKSSNVEDIPKRANPYSDPN